jgi:hypothetical protein
MKVRAWQQMLGYREITAVTGRGDPAGKPDYADIARAALAAPVVYLGAASDGGFALIVRDQGEPTCIELPRLTRDALTGRVEAFRQKPSQRAARKCVDWLADPALAGLLPTIADDLEIALVTLVTLGALNTLPVNGALLRATRHRAAGPVVRLTSRNRPSDQERSGPVAPA